MTAPVAIIGVGMRLPGADSLDAFWAHLAAGRSLITEVPARRWSASELYGNPASGNKTNSIWGGFVADADAFDAAFFNISPREASWMDPQQRFALEMVWHAIEDAGLRASALAGSRTGVYMGVCHWDYAELIQKHLARVDAYTPTGIAFSVIANRVSHAFDFRGPSVTNDTACAASLVAINEAVRALESGECDLAFAGGVNLAWSPDHFIAFAKSGMLSRDGKAKAFDARADGYVRGEGGGVLLLKPLAHARRDGDPIHAIISGIGINHGGRTSSLTVTNPNAQADLIAEVHRLADVSPDSVSYIEAHGPGTPLGDPIEIAGLKAAFRARAAETGIVIGEGSCGVGSVKTNIGHLEGAAGVAGVLKVLAALKHGSLPPNVGFETINPLIDLAGSPFRIQSETTPWPLTAGRPRRAGVSSFGFGGTNAHAVIEDADEIAPAAKDTDAPIAVPLSARSDEALRRYAEALRDFLVHSPGSSLAEIAMTFQTGREPMGCRVAFVATSCAELRAALAAFIDAVPDSRVRVAGAEVAKAEPWRTADVWAAGEDATFDCPEGARRIHGPLYPFMRERFWFDAGIGAKDSGSVPHPFLHRNVSTFGAVAYRSRFSGSEYFLAEHQVQGEHVLPGVVALEMVRAAYVAASTYDGALRISDVVWPRAVVAGEDPIDVELRLNKADGGGANFTLADGKATQRIFVQGRVEQSAAISASHDLAALKAAAVEEIEPQRCYEMLTARGVVHGPAFQAIETVWRGDGFVVADLRLPRRLAGTLAELPLHPVLLDAAIQAWVALDPDAPDGAGVPFACREVAVTGPCETRMSAFVRPSSAARSSSSVLHLDIDLAARDGRVCVTFKDVALRLVGEALVQAPEQTAAVPDDGLVLAQGVWVEAGAKNAASPVERQCHVFVAGELSGSAAALAARSGLKVHVLPPINDENAAETVGSWFRALQSHLADQIGARSSVPRKAVVLLPDGLAAYLSAPLAGLLKTVTLEYPKLSGVVVRVAGALNADRLARIVSDEAACADTFVDVRHDGDGRRLVLRHVPLADRGRQPVPLHLDANGVYWITGGLGGLGLIFAEALAGRGARHIVLSGRRDVLPANSVARIDALRARSVTIQIMPCDVANEDEVARLVAEIEGSSAPLRGVIHAAGVLDDAYIFGGDLDRCDDVLRPKVSGTLAIDKATAHLDLQFLALCSSVASVFGNAGQAAYAGANAFMDAFAEQRAAAVARGERCGRTLAIAWPLWADGGMTVEAPFKEALRRRFGTDPLPRGVGIEALWRLLAIADAPRSIVLYGNRTRLDALLANATASGAGQAVPENEESAGDAGLSERVIGHLKELLSEAMEIDAARIRADTPLVEYGLDSIIIIDVTARLEQTLGPLSKTLFFEYVTLAALAAHLVDEHAAALARALPAPVAAKPAATKRSNGDARSEAVPQREASKSPEAGDAHDIAIVGLSLRVAKAASQDAFWEMLSKGLHSVGPVPRERWDHDAIYDPDRNVLGKTVVKSGAFLDDIDKFDPRYFRISQAEAELMSPEVRLFLEASVEAFEDAGYSRDTLQQKFGGDVAVIVGSMTNEYDYFGFQNMLARGAPASGSYTGTIPNMVSYFYGLTGPSYFLDTMCSAAATCIHEAVHMLRAGRCGMVLAGGVSLLLHPQKLIAVSQEHFTSKTADVVRGYGVGADGTILGEGVGAVVLKRRADAVRDGDHIYGVIKGTAVTNAGVRNGFTVPSPGQQAAAITKAIDDAGIDPRTIGYIEGHGSGTALGDPIEVRALTQAFRAHTADTQFCPIGTVKSNVAHLLAAAALPGVVKVLLQMKHGELVPSLHAETLNPDIPFAKTPFYVQRTRAPWLRMADADGNELPRRAGVTSIGAGGMNAHLIIEEHRPEARAAHPGGPEVAVFSAMNGPALRALASRMHDFIAAHPELSLADIAFTLQAGRNALPCRLAIVADSREDLVEKLLVFLQSPASGVGMWFTPNILDREVPVDAGGVAAATAARSLDRVAEYWAAGVAVDWNALHTGRRPCRVSLPAYPFERVRCWYPEFADAPSVLRPSGRDGVRVDSAADGENSAAIAQAPAAASPARPDSHAPIREALTDLAAGLLKFDPASLNSRASFFDLGFDSISLTRFAAAIGERFGVVVSPALFFECEHIEALAQHLIANNASISTPRAREALAGTAHRDGGRMKIAIVGAAVRLPGADDLGVFIDRLLSGDDLTGPFPFHRYDGAYAERLRQAGFAKHGGFLEDVDRFDASFFRVSPVEVERMDPQQRLMLETSWRALQQAGYRPEDVPRDMAVFVGVSGRDYASLLEAHNIPHDGFAATGNSLAIVANRISYHLDVHGPSEAIDTACSSSLVALARAADAIASGSCSMALVGGVNLALAVEGFEGPHLAGMLSPAGRCKPFSADADGYGRGEGVVAMLLKPLVAAEADGDSILGVVIGGAVNHGGRAGSLTAPNAKAQAAVIKQAMSGIDPASIGYIETHGTGTALGDPVEIAALNIAYTRLLDEAATQVSIGLGSVKSNIGHLEAAAGLAGVAKVLGAMRRGEIPATLHCGQINPHIVMEGTPFSIVRERAGWRRRADATGAELPRRAGVSSFGFGGVNAHVVLQEYPDGAGRRPPLPAPVLADTRYWIPGHSLKTVTQADEVVLQAPRWIESPLPRSDTGSHKRRLVLTCGVALSSAPECRVVDCDRGTGDIGSRYLAAAGAAVEALQRELRRVDARPILVQLVHPAGGDDELFAGLGALLDTAAAEHPNLVCQVVGVPAGLARGAVATLLDAEAEHPQHRRVRREASRRLVKTWVRIAEPRLAPPVWRDGGVYLITGAMGGVGRLVAADIAKRAKRPVLILAGRSALDPGRQAFLDALGQSGAVASYHAVDVADRVAISRLVGDVVNRHGALNGVVHCAGVLRDRTLLNKTRVGLDAVLEPKVRGALALVEACRDRKLDHLVLFSSLAGAFGNAGQCDYAAANGFLDSLAASAGDGLPIVSVNWPLWRDGGMRVSDAGKAALFEQMGQRPLETEAGLAALGTILSGTESQVAVVAGEAARIDTFFAVASTNSFVPAEAPSLPSGSHLPERLLQRTSDALRHLLARVSGVSSERIAADIPLEAYGIDSLMVTRLNRELGDVFGRLSAALLFEHRTLVELARYLIQHHAEGCRRLTGESAEVPVAPPAAPALRDTSFRSANGPVSVPQDDPIAIIGMSGRYPGSPDLDAYWENILAGRDLIAEVPADRWAIEGFFEPDIEKAVAKGQSYSKWGGFLEGFADFDPLFFKIAPRDAAAMDPQERLFLMSAWAACEDAGYSRARLRARHAARVGVYVGVTKSGFALHGAFAGEGGALVRPTTSFAGIANRVSYALDLNGPSLPIDTMCSSSLTAIHEACEALRAGTCALALAGGVNLYLHPSNFVELSAARMLSPDGRCKSFGAGANGFVPGEGVGCIVLKPLSRAIADGDRIHAVIRGTAVNHGGRTNGFTVPNPSAQRDVIRAALDAAGLAARDVTYIEAHGTGTDLGDPIEVSALTQAFEADTAERGFCALGSVKSNIGHLEAAAGIAGLTKVVLQMKHQILAPTLHAAAVNPNLDFAATPFQLQTERAPWMGPRVAGISSFGAGGANAHVIIEEWRNGSVTDSARAAVDRGGRIYPIVLSARDADRLRDSAVRLLAAVEHSLAAPAESIDANGSGYQSADALRAKIAQLLNVAPTEIDDAESFEALGFDFGHRLALGGWLELEYNVVRADQMVRDARTPAQLLAALGWDAWTPPAPTAEGFRLRLADIAWTLQVGREAMDERLAIEARCLEELAAGLRAFVDGRTDHAGLHRGNAEEHRPIIAALSGDDASSLTRSWMERGSLGRLLAFWVRGLPVDWEDLRGPGGAQIVSLPTYPFRSERYWIGTSPVSHLPLHARVPQALSGQVSDSAALLAGVETLDKAIAPLVRALVASHATGPPAKPFNRWHAALNDLLPAGEALACDAAWRAWSLFRESTPQGIEAQARLAETMLRALPDILIGKRSAPEVMFPDGKLDQVEAVYADNPVAARFSAGLARVAADWISARLSAAPGVPFKVLEIGAGTGATSEHMFAALAPFGSAIAEYRYTDVSRAFLIKAERRFKTQVPSLMTALFDVEKPPEGQGIAREGYDLVIAANVLHATSDIHRTLRHVLATLAPSGALLLNETSRATLFTHVTFGLLEGWWRFTDGERRIPGTPSLAPAAWLAALKQVGLTPRIITPAEDLALGQQLLIAERPAVGRAVRGAAATAINRRDVIRRAVAQTLNMPIAAVAVDKPFADYGLDSILGAELVERLRGALGIRLEQTRLYDFGNVLRLEDYIARTFPAAPAQPSESGGDAACSAPALLNYGKAADERVDAGDRGPIAIVGVSGRFAQSPDVETFWTHLHARRDLVQPATRFAGAHGRRGSFIETFDRFDSMFFGISGLEATYMDPQQRLFLEEAWKALEHAGHAGAAIEGRRCGVFVGCSAGDYQELFRTQPPGQAFWGNTASLIPARIAYCLDLKGPAIAVDTACSSSLVALDLACRSLWSGECEMALAGGVFVQCTDRFFRYADAANMLSPAGRCAAFGAEADGIVPGEAVAAVLLRPLSRAVADGDTIHGLIVASGTNQDGATNGITAPSAVSQERLMRDVYAKFGIDAAGIGYVEAHGTGTRLGDPIEYDALARVYSETGAAPGSCLLGSVKSNLGHATTAAGIASVIKVLGALRAGSVPPTLHASNVNPAIRLEQGPFRINQESEPWPAKRGRRRAAISSFGFSGTNAHAVLEEAPPAELSAADGREHLVVLSARTAAQLRQQAERLVAHLAGATDLTLRDVAFTLLAGRRHLPHRLAVVASGVANAASCLSGWLEGRADSGVRSAVVDAAADATEKFDVRHAGLKDLADGFLAGVVLDAEVLFAGSGRKRVPLPVYPFAETRYWIEPAPPSEVFAATDPGTKPVAVSAPVAQHRLKEPVAVVDREAAPGRVVKVKLAPLDFAPPSLRSDAEIEPAIHVEREIAGGVCSLTTQMPWGERLEAALADELRDVSAMQDVRAVVLRIPEGWSASGTAEVAERFKRAVEDCGVPVVASVAPQSGAVGHGAGLACDFVSPPDAAASLAHNIARAPRLALVELKRHLLRTPLLGSETAPALEPLRAIALDVAVPAAGIPQRIALASEAVTLDVFDDGVAILRMEDRAGRNTFTPGLMDGLCEAFALAANLSSVRVLVLTGFDSYFACGGTADGLESLQRGETQFTDRRIYSLPLECPLPVIAAMQGHAIGAGWALGMFCDITLFADEGVYHSNYLELGFTPGAGATLVFPHKLGNRLGREVLFSATQFKGRELKARTPALNVHAAADVLTEALSVAHRLACVPRSDLIAAKAVAVAPVLQALADCLSRELAMHRRTFVGNADVLTRIRAAFDVLPPLPETREVQPPVRGDLELLREIRAKVVASLSEELMIGADEIRDGSGFLDLGLDSILAVTWIRRLNSVFGTSLPATAVYAHPTVGALVERLARDAPAQVSPPPAPAAATVPEPSPVPTVRRRNGDRQAIAVIGMSGRFPKAGDLEAFWENIRTGRDCVSEVPRERWDIASHYDPDPQAPGKTYCKWMGAIDRVDRFDPGFFNITPREAELMDPQQRLFLQHAWHAIEDAAIDPASLAGVACGVFVGSGPSGYADLIRERNAYSLLGAAGSILAARIAYHLDLTGPAVSLDTACSSSLVAIAEACDSLVLGNSDMALAGGACVLIGPSMFVDTSKVSMLSPGGRCYTFDARANGFVPGEGVGVMLLKRHDDALRDGDPIRAVIRGWGVNQDGKTNGIAAPNPVAQSRLIRGIHQRFGITPESIGLIECHGTGTALGDPIEIEGLVGAFAGSSAPQSSCAIGAVKSNVGHLLASAGVAGAMKAILALEHAELPPTIHVERVNPHLDLAGSPFVINTEARPWRGAAGAPRRAGVSAFGFSGTNAHIVVEAAAVAATTAGRDAGPWVLPISARAPERVQVYAASLVRFVAAKPDLDLAALSATFQHGRTVFAARRAVVFRDRATLSDALTAIAAGAEVSPSAQEGGLAALARRWTDGENVVWPALSAGRISAPGYPFAEERYWAETEAAANITPVKPRRASRSAGAAKAQGRIAIIGGGPTGIGVGRELSEAGIAFDLFEAESDFGGVWNSEAGCGRTYNSLHLISPKFNTQVQDFPMPEDYPAYPNHEQMLRYIRAYARAFGLYEAARFNAPVTRLDRQDGSWRLATGDGFEGIYDLAVIATGLQRLPLYPDPAYPGTFEGEVLHTRDYKSADQIRGRRVLVIGGGNSGCDIAAEAVHHAKSVLHSTRRGYHYQPKFIAGKPTPQWMMELGGKFDTKDETLAYIEEVFRLAGYDGADYGLPRPDYPLDGAHPIMNTQLLYHIGHGDIVPKGDVDRFAGKRVHFRDGSSEEADLIVYATGYKRDFSFLDKSLIEWKSGIPDLFLHSVPRNHDDLLFMGFINAAGGLGDGLKTQGLFVRDYARAYFGRTRGLDAFLRAKAIDTPDLGQDQFVSSYRHLWEADLWKLLAQMRKYRDILNDGAAASLVAAQ